MQQWAPFVSSAGLLVDIAGAIYVVKSLLWVSDKELAEASDSTGTWAGGDEPTPRAALLEMFRSSRRDARIGATLLILGFLGQLLGLWMAR